LPFGAKIGYIESRYSDLKMDQVRGKEDSW